MILSVCYRKQIKRWDQDIKNIKPDLPTPITCKSGGFEKKPRKTWRLGPQTWKLQKYASNEINSEKLFVSEYSLPYKCLSFYRELLYHDRELVSQTVSLTVKPWGLEGLSSLHV